MSVSHRYAIKIFKISISIENTYFQCHMRIGDCLTKMEKYKDQLYLVKSNKEYDSLNNEIDHIKGEISESETNLITRMEEKQELEEEIKLKTEEERILIEVEGKRLKEEEEGKLKEEEERRLEQVRLEREKREKHTEEVTFEINCLSQLKELL